MNGSFLECHGGTTASGFVAAVFLILAVAGSGWAKDLRGASLDRKPDVGRVALALPALEQEIAAALQDIRDQAQKDKAGGQGVLAKRAEVSVEGVDDTNGRVRGKDTAAVERNLDKAPQSRWVTRTLKDLRSDYERLARHHEELLRRFDRLSKSNELLLQRHEQLQRNVGDLLRHNKELQANISELKTTRARLQENRDKLQQVYAEVRRRSPDYDAFSAPSYRSAGPARPGGNGNGRPNGTLFREPANFPPDFTN